MNKKEFFEYIVPKVEPYFLKQGFIYQKSKDAFVKPIEDGWIHVSFSFFQFALTNRFNAGFLLRKNKVQDLLIKYIKQNPANHKTSPTIIFALTSLERQKDHSFRDNSFSFNSIERLGELLENKVIPFIENDVPYFSEKYSQLSNVYRLITDPSEEYNELIFPHYSNYITALIIGWMAYPDNFDNVVKTVNELFLKIKAKYPDSLHVEQYEENFDKVVEDLKAMKPIA